MGRWQRSMANTFGSAACATQLCIRSGEPLLSVDYEDPDFDNLYFNDRNIGDDDSLLLMDVLPLPYGSNQLLPSLLDLKQAKSRFPSSP